MGESAKILSPYMRRLWKNRLTELGWTAGELAKAAKLSPNYVRRIVNGTLLPGKDALHKLCEIAKLNLEVIAREFNAERDANTPDNDPMSYAAGHFSLPKRTTSVFNETSPPSQQNPLSSSMIVFFDMLPIEDQMALMAEALKRVDEHRGKH